MQYIQKPNGQMNGSIGDGRDDIPSTPNLPLSPTTSSTTVVSLSELATTLQAQQDADLSTVNKYNMRLVRFGHLFEHLIDYTGTDSSWERAQVALLKDLSHQYPEMLPCLASYCEKQMAILDEPILEYLQEVDDLVFSPNVNTEAIAGVIGDEYGFTEAQKQAAHTLLEDGYESNLADFVATIRALSPSS